MDCDVAREALSARMDGEREPVPSARTDEHVAGCADCQSWRAAATAQAERLHALARPRPGLAATPDGRPTPWPRWCRRADLGWRRWALLGTGLVQTLLAIAQGGGLPLGLTDDHGAAGHGSEHGAGHLLNESTAWTVAIGVAMIAAALRPALAAGVAGVLLAFAGVLAGYEITDTLSGAVTAERTWTHLPVVAGALLAVLVGRAARRRPPEPDDDRITLPANASHGRPRGHLRAADDSAA